MSAPKTIHIGMRGEIICHVQKEPSVNTELEYRLAGTCEWTKTSSHGWGSGDIATSCDIKEYYDEDSDELIAMKPYCPCCGDKIKVVQ